MNRRPLIVLALAVATGGLAAYLAASALQPSSGVAEVARQAGRIAVAARDLPAGTVLRAEDLRTIPWSEEALPAGFVGGVETLVGRGLLTSVSANEPLLRRKLAPTGTGGGLPLIIPPGMRAMSVAVDEVVAVAGFVGPGTRVDVLVTAQEVGAAALTRLILQNVLVLASGQTLEPDRQGKPQTSSVITLLVSPSDAEVLALASAEGQIQLALRNTLDEGRATTGGSTLASLTARGLSPAPVTAPIRTTRARAARAPLNSVEIYHGGKRTVEIF